MKIFCSGVCFITSLIILFFAVNDSVIFSGLIQNFALIKIADSFSNSD